MNYNYNALMNYEIVRQTHC